MQNKELSPISATKLNAENQKKNSDRILVRDYVKMVEIGAFQPEYHIKQRVSFTVVLEVKTQKLPLHDNVDFVLSYDNIIEIIEEEVNADRVDLLETLAEQVALSCLGLEGVLEAMVRIEKLDKGAGKLGVEILRRSSETAKDILKSHRDRKIELNVQKRIPNTGLLFVSNSIIENSHTGYLHNFLVKAEKKWVVCFSEIFKSFLKYNDDTNDIKIRLMAISQSAIKFQGFYPKWPLARSKTEVSFLLKNDSSCLWCPKNNFMGKEVYHSLGKSFSYSLAADLAKNLFLTDIYIFSNDKEANLLKKKCSLKGIKVKTISI